MMLTWTYPARIERHADDEYVVSFPDVPEALTSARTEGEALALAEDAIEEAILGYLAQGRAVPQPRPAKNGERAAPLDPTTAARAALADKMREQRVSNVALAARLDKSEGAVRRLIDGRTGVKIDTVLDALDALGARAVLSFI